MKSIITTTFIAFIVLTTISSCENNSGRSDDNSHLRAMQIDDTLYTFCNDTAYYYYKSENHTDIVKFPLKVIKNIQGYKEYTIGDISVERYSIDSATYLYCSDVVVVNAVPSSHEFIIKGRARLLYQEHVVINTDSLSISYLSSKDTLFLRLPRNIIIRESITPG